MKTPLLVNRLRQNRFICSVMTLASASAAGQVIMLVATPALTRLYTPEAFGVLAVFSGLMGIVLMVSSLRYELAIPLPSSDRDASQLLVLALSINFITAGVVLLAVIFLRHKAAIWMETPSLSNMLWMLPVAILAAGSYKSLNYWAVRNRDYRRLARTKITQGIANVITQVIGGLVGLGAIGLILGQVIGQSAGTNRLMKGIDLKRFFRLARNSNLRNLVLLRKHYRFPMFDVPAASINAISTQLPNLLLAVLFSPAAAGFYYLAERILATPMTIVGQAVAQVLYGQSRENIRDGVLRDASRRIFMVLTILIIPPVLFLFMFSEPIFVILFGEAWREAGMYASWLVIGLAVQFIYSPLSMILMATEGQLFNFAIHSLLLLLKLCGLYLGFLAGNALLGIQGLVIALCVGYGIGIIVVLHRTTKY